MPLSNESEQQQPKQAEPTPGGTKVGDKRIRDAAADQTLNESGSSKLLKPDADPDCVEVGIQCVLGVVEQFLERSDKPLCVAEERVHKVLNNNNNIEYEDEEEIEKIAEKLFGDGSVVGCNVARAQLGLEEGATASTVKRTAAFRKKKPKYDAFVEAVVAACMLEKCEEYCEKKALDASRVTNPADEEAEMNRVEYYERNMEMLCEALDCGGWRTFLDALRQEDYDEAFAAYQDLGEYEYIQSVA